MATPLEQALASVRAADVALAGLLRTLSSGAVGRDAGLPEEMALIASARVTSRDARMLLGIRDALAHMPATSAMLGRGDISFSQIKQIAYEVKALRIAERALLDSFIARVAPDLREADADALVDQVGFEVARLTASRQARLDARLAEQEFLWVQPDLDGGAKLFAQMGQELAATVLEALDHVAERPVAPGDDDDLGARGMQRARALGRMCEQALAGVSDGTARPRLHVTCDIRTLADSSEPGHVQWRLPGRPATISPDLTQMLACDAEVVPVVFDGATPLAYGPVRKTIPERVRSAVLVRDAGCRWPGHRTPVAWCDVHHTIPGNHDPTTLITLCRPCHRRAHLQRWRITPIRDGRFRFRRGRQTLESAPSRLAHR